MNWTEESIERFSRQVVLKQIGVKGQETLCRVSFALPDEAPWNLMAELLRRAGMTWEKKEGHWMREGDRVWFLMARAPKNEEALYFLMASQPVHCTEDIPVDHPLFHHAGLGPCLATWWCSLALALPGAGDELTFTPKGVKTV